MHKKCNDIVYVFDGAKIDIIYPFNVFFRVFFFLKMGKKTSSEIRQKVKSIEAHT